MLKQLEYQAFRDTQGLSFSKLSKLADGPQSYKAGLEEKEFSLGLAFGSVVDALLTNPESLHTDYYVMTADKPSSEMMIKFCEVYAETGSEERAHAASGFKIGLNVVLTKFQIEGKPYYDALVLGKGKKIIDVTTMFAANQTVTTLKSNPFTKEYFDNTNPDIEIYHQVPIIWETELTRLSLVEEPQPLLTTFKGLIDLIKIDHKKKEIEIVDIKTGAESFWKSFWKWKLYLQGSMYYHGFKEFIKGTELESYKVKETIFIYADSNLYYPPIIYVMTEKDVRCARLGYYPVFTAEDKRVTEPKVKGYERLAEELDWHIRNDAWDYSFDVYKRNGRIEIDAFNPKI